MSCHLSTNLHSACHIGDTDCYFQALVDYAKGNVSCLEGNDIQLQIFRYMINNNINANTIFNYMMKDNSEAVRKLHTIFLKNSKIGEYDYYQENSDVDDINKDVVNEHSDSKTLEKTSNSSSNTGLIIGILLGCIALILIIGISIYFYKIIYR
jgi:hypothetical protein